MRGSLRLHAEDPEEVEITEHVVPVEDEGAVLAFVRKLARRMKRPSVMAWMPPTPTIEAVFEPGTRSTTLSMVRGHWALDHSMFWSSDYF